MHIVSRLFVLSKPDSCVLPHAGQSCRVWLKSGTRTMPAVSEDDRGLVLTAVIGVVALCANASGFIHLLRAVEFESI